MLAYRVVSAEANIRQYQQRIPASLDTLSILQSPTHDVFHHPWKLIAAFIVFACFITCLLAPNASAEPASVTPLEVEYLIDSAQKYQAKELFHNPAFQILKQNNFAFFKPSPNWLRFKLKNNTDTPLAYTLDLGSHFINKATLFYYQQGQLMQREAGLDLQHTRDVLQNKHINFSLSVPAQQQTIYLIHLDSHFFNRIKPVLLTEHGNYEIQWLETSTSYTLIGIIIGGICYLLLISLVIKERQENVYFIAYLISSCILISFIHNDIYSVFSNAPGLFENFLTLIMSINAVSFITFYQRFFSVASICKLGFNLLNGFSVFYTALFISTIVFQHTNFFTIFSITTSILLVLLLRFSWLNWCKDIRYTLPFTLCLLSAIMINGLYILSNYNLIADFFLFKFGFAIANSMLVFVFAMNLANRIIEVRDQQFEAASKAATAIAESNAKGDFLAKMSHEIRTPMNGVLGMVQLLKETPLNKIQDDYIQVIEQSGSTLVTVINDILDYSKIEAGKLQLDYSALTIQELVDNIILTFEEQSKNKQLILKSKIHDTVPSYVIGDINRLNQILINLLSNALKFTQQGSISVEVQALYQNKQQQHIIRFSVTDTGIGIEKKRLNSLFNAFEQADTSTTRIYGGTGLGLTICEQLIHLMQGEIGIHSEPEKGSCIWFDIPMTEAEKPPQPKKESASVIRRATDNIVVFSQNKNNHLSCTTAKDILVAEDNEVNQKVLSGMLKQLGYQADFVNNGLEALNRVKQHHNRYQLLLMDCEMPIMDGYTASDRIRIWETDNRLSKLPIIAVTAHALDEMREKSLAHGMDDHLSKPIKLAELSDHIKYWLSTSQSQ
ncbi:MAG: response regulator [Pseudomonadales bacterium]|nr:response regulator [Pseudomonadales bacterium]